ncbi:MAG: DUF362 domain-containing protein [Pseudomonadota bacterium]
MDESRKSTRREFIFNTARATAGFAALGVAGCFPDVGGNWPHITGDCVDSDETEPLPGASPVAEIVRDDSVQEVAGGFEIQQDVVQEMLDQALGTIAGNAAKPWQTLLPDASSTTRIGIKVNCLNEYLSSSVALVRALVESLRAGLGIAGEQIIVWDRRGDELARGGFSESTLGTRVVGTVASTADASGPGYGEAICGVVAGKTPRISRILTELTDLTISVPVLKTHPVSGITAAMKNIYGVVHNPGDYHQNLAVALPALYRLPPIRRSIRLTICDALIAVTLGGTSDPPDAVPRRILVARDPLALDCRALALVNSLRAERSAPPVDPAVTGWLDNAYDLGLGTMSYKLEP